MGKSRITRRKLLLGTAAAAGGGLVLGLLGDDPADQTLAD